LKIAEEKALRRRLRYTLSTSDDGKRQGFTKRTNLKRAA